MKKIFIIFFAISMPMQLYGVEYKYYSGGRRDPFIPLITGEIKRTLGLESVETIENIKFEGIIFDPQGKSIAVLNGEVVKEGDKVYNIEIVKIYDNAIALKIHDKSYMINLVEEGGEIVER